MQENVQEHRQGTPEVLHLGALSSWQEVVLTIRRYTSAERVGREVISIYKLTVDATQNAQNGTPVRLSRLSDQQRILIVDDNGEGSWIAVDQGVHRMIGCYTVGSMRSEIDGSAVFVQGELRLGSRAGFKDWTPALDELVTGEVIGISVEGSVMSVAA